MKLRVDVYWNTHRDLYSIRYKGKVIAHAHEVEITGADLVVSERVRDRVRAEGKKYVHAFIRGELTGINGVEYLADDLTDPVRTALAGRWYRGFETDMPAYKQVRYNPYTLDYWTCMAGLQVDKADRVHLMDRRLVRAVGVTERDNSTALVQGATE